MICPQCNKTPRCIDSRQRGPTRWRRYACECGYRFSTDEAIVGTRIAEPEPVAPPDLTNHIEAIEMLTGTITEAIATYRRGNA